MPVKTTLFLWQGCVAGYTSALHWRLGLDARYDGTGDLGLSKLTARNGDNLPNPKMDDDNPHVPNAGLRRSSTCSTSAMVTIDKFARA
jgi:hypothetical protein